MEKTKRNPALKVIGAILIVAGVITFIVSAVQLYDVQTTTTHWAEGFMQDYQQEQMRQTRFRVTYLWLLRL